MSDRNKLDDFFKKKLGERQPVFDVNAWSQMESLLEEKPKKERKWIFLWLFMGLAVLAIAVWGIQAYEVQKNTLDKNYAKKEEVNNAITETPVSNQKNKKETERQSLNKKTIINQEKSTKHKGQVPLVKESPFEKTVDYVPANGGNTILHANQKRNHEGVIKEAVSSKLISENENDKSSVRLKKNNAIREAVPIKLGDLKLLTNVRAIDLKDQFDIDVKVKKNKRLPSIALYAAAKSYIRETTNSNLLGLGWEAGLELTQPIGSNWGLGTGVSFYQRNKFLNRTPEVELIRLEDSNIQTMGQDSLLVSYPSNNVKLTYLKIPVFVAYQKGKSRYQLGAWGSYIIDVTGDLEQLVVTNNAVLGGVEENAFSRAFIMDDLSGYRRFDYGLDLKYAYQLSPSLEFSMGFSYGLTSVFDDNSNNDAFEADTISSSGFPDVTFNAASVSRNVVRGRQMYLDIGLKYRF